MTTAIRRLIGRLQFQAEVAAWYARRPFWIAAGWTRLKLLPDSLHQCDECCQLATWSYAPSDGNYHLCDEHVLDEDRRSGEWFRNSYGFQARPVRGELAIHLYHAWYAVGGRHIDRTAAWARRRFASGSLEPCRDCGAPAAQWEYVPMGQN
jgi:hypothetical protein